MRKKTWKYTLIAFLATFTCAFAFGVSACTNGENSSSSEVQQSGGSLELGGIYLSENNITMRIGETKQIQASVAVTEWQSGNEEILTVENGLITAKAAGTAFVYAITDSGKLSCFVNVTNETFAPEVKLNRTQSVLRIGDEISLTASVSVDGSPLQDLVTWSNSAPDVVTITANENTVNIKAIASGSAQVVATLGSVSVVCEITVKNPDDLTGFFEDCQEMSNATLTQLDFQNGIKTDSVSDGDAPVSLYENAYYGTYKNNENVDVSAIVVYATLETSARTAIDLTYENYYNYGFLVEVYQTHDSAYSELEEQSYRYYTSAEANEQGQYGIFIQNVVDGYYCVRAFVEYANNGTIVCDVSTDVIALGKLKYSIVSEASDFTFKVADGPAMSYGTKYDVNAVSETVADADGLEINAKYKAIIPDTNVVLNFNSAKFNVKPSVTKKVLNELGRTGYTHLVFYAMYKTETTEAAGAKCLKLSDSLAETNPAESESSVISSHLLSVTHSTNKWYKYEYLVSDLVKCYDVVFATDTEYPFIQMTKRSMEGGEFYISDFTLEKRVAEPETLNINAFIDGQSVASNWDVIFVEQNDVLTANVQAVNPYGINLADDYVLKINGQELKGDSYTFQGEGQYTLTATSEKYETTQSLHFIVGTPDLDGIGDMAKALVANSQGWRQCSAPNNAGTDSAYDKLVELNGKTAHHWDLYAPPAGNAYAVKQIYFTNYYEVKSDLRQKEYALDLELLQTLSEKGYTTLSFSVALASDTVDGATSSVPAKWYTLDFDKVAVEDDIESKITDYNTQYHFMVNYMTQKTCTENEWVEVSFSIQDLIEYYDVLDVIPLIAITGDNNYNMGDLYMTNFTFWK